GERRFARVGPVEIEPAKTLAGGGQLGIVTGRGGYLGNSCGDAINVDVDLHRLGFLFGDSRLTLLLAVRRFLGWFYRVVRLVGGFIRMQLVGGLEGRAQALFERELVNLERAIEVRVRLSRSPGRRHHGLQRAV